MRLQALTAVLVKIHVPERLDPEDEGISVLTEHLELLALWHSITSDKIHIFSKHLAFFWVFCLFLTTWET